MSDRDLDTWKAAVRRALPGELALCRLYACTVRVQRADGTLDVEPDDKATLGGSLAAVPILHGLPGVRVRVAAGARVLVGFLGGWREVAEGEAPDGARPFAALWETDATMVEIVIGGGSKPFARVGDTAGRLLWDPTAMTLYYAPSQTAPYLPVSVNPLSPMPPVALSPGTAVTIDSGLDAVKG